MSESIHSVRGHKISPAWEKMVIHTIDDDASNIVQGGMHVYVGGSGDLAVQFMDDSLATIVAYNNQYLLLVKKVFATSTTATDILTFR